MRVTYHEARNRALRDILDEDPRACILGNEFTTPFEPPSHLLRDYGPGRVWPTPISEQGFCGLAVGAALVGLHPIVDLSTGSFAFNAWEAIVNEAPNLRYMSGGQVSVPVVFHLLSGARGSAAAQHSHAPQAMLWNTPGLRILCPASPQDVYGLLRTALRDPNPCIFLDPIRLFDVEGELDPSQAVPYGQARVWRRGGDVTVVAVSALVPAALEAADRLAAEGVGVEVVDPRTLVPFDEEAVLASVARTGRLVVADETHRSCGVAAEIAARVAERGFALLRAPIRRVAMADVPVPYSPVLEARLIPGVEDVVAAVRSCL